MPSPLTLPVRYTRHQPPCGAPLRRGSALDKSVYTCWPLNEGAGGTMHDAAWVRPGTIHGATWAPTPFGRGLNFASGGGQWVDLGGSPLYANNPAGSLSFWISSTTANTAAEQSIYSEDQSGGTVWRFIKQSNNDILFHQFPINGNAGVTNAVGTPPLTWDGRWYHIVGTWDTTQMNIYLNGALSAHLGATGQCGWPIVAAQWGRYSNGGGGYYLDASIAAPMGCSRLLSPAEVRSLWLAPFQCF